MKVHKNLSENEMALSQRLEFAPNMKTEFQQLTKVVRKIHTMTGIDLFPFLSKVEFPVREEPVDTKLDITVLE